MHTIKITPNCRIESKKINSVARIESNRNFFCPNWNALQHGRSINSEHDTWQPRLSCGCGQSMQRRSANDQGLTATADILRTIKNIALSHNILLRRNDGSQ